MDNLLRVSYIKNECGYEKVMSNSEFIESMKQNYSTITISNITDVILPTYIYQRVNFRG